jgi:hypothetical protein
VLYLLSLGAVCGNKDRKREDEHRQRKTDPTAVGGPRGTGFSEAFLYYRHN